MSTKPPPHALPWRVQPGQFGDRPALRWHGLTMTHHELAQLSIQLGHHLRTKGLRRGSVIGVSLSGFDLVTALIAILRMGAIYLPIDPDLPLARQRLMLETAGANALLVADGRADRFEDIDLQLVRPEAEREWIERQRKDPLPVSRRIDLPAYIIFTSGSSGRPKGVVVGSGALTNKIVSGGAWAPFAAKACAPLTASIGFDASLAQILLPLSRGGSVSLLDFDQRVSGKAFWRMAAEHGMSIVDGTPSWFAAMLDTMPASMQLDQIVLGGEVLSPALVRRIQERLPATQIINAYGPTEACIDAAAYRVTPATDARSRIPIGQALDGYHLFLGCPDTGAPTDGEEGELCIGGPGLAMGYWRNPEATHARFVEVPQSMGPARRHYRTGDLVRRLANGDYVFVARTDDQLKVRGQRVELGEIEHCIAQAPGVVACAVRVDSDIVSAYIVLRSDVGAHSTALATAKAYVAEHLPPALCPGSWTICQDLPLTPSGKLDRARLPQAAAAFGTGKRPPVTPIESRITDAFRDVLELSNVGVDDNFFEIGGHSLLAAAACSILSHSLTDWLSGDLPVSVLFQHPTAASLALAISDRKRFLSNKGAIELRKGVGGTPPLFCVPPLSGIGTVYTGLARDLGRGIPVHAFQATGLGRLHGPSAMEELAGAFITAMRLIQPEGPYRLCGYSAGGGVAHAMANLLVHDGEAVSMLVLIDAYLDLDPAGRFPHEWRPLSDDVFWRCCADLLGDLGLADDRLPLGLRTARSLWDARATSLSRLRPDQDAMRAALSVFEGLIDPALLLLMLEGTYNMCAAHFGHTPAPATHGPDCVLSLRPSERSSQESAWIDLQEHAWARLYGDAIRNEIVSGSHITLLKADKSRKAIAALIDEALGDGQVPALPITSSGAQQRVEAVR